METSPQESPYRKLLGTLASHDVGESLFNEPLAGHCSWQIGGPADILIQPQNPEQVAAVTCFARRHAVPLLVIGQGTNLLFDDAGLRGIVLKVGASMARFTVAGTRIVAEAGVWVPQLARQAARAGLAGLEHAIGIPGTLGGLVLMNGGSHRKGIGENVHRVWLVDREGHQAVLTREECRFSYRHSALQDTGAVVLKVELECATGDPRRIRREMLEDLRERRRKFPRKEPNCGSVFLSTGEMHATVGPPGKIIEEAGLKGFCIGHAEVSRRHANFIVNQGGATCADVLALITHIRKVVREKIGFDLRCEVRYVRPDGVIVPADQANKESCKL
jgi:UDP-N-acetylmuramate dehydrogenase